MNKSPQSDEDSFYKELDQKRAHQSCCTCPTLAILFLTILLVIGFSVSWIFWKITREIKFPQINSKLANLSQLSSRISDLKSSSTGQVSIPVTEDEFNFLIAEGFSTGNFIFRNPRAEFGENKIIIYAQLTKPLNSQIVFDCTPRANKGRIEFDVSNFSAGSMKIPEMATGKLAPLISDFISSKFDLVYRKIYVDDVKFENNKMLIIGKEN